MKNPQLVEYWKTRFNGFQMFYENIPERGVPTGISSKQQLTGLHKPIIRTFWKPKVHLSFIDSIWVFLITDI